MEMEHLLLTMFDKNDAKFTDALYKLFKETHKLGPQDDYYEWCMVVTRNSEVKVYEQLKEVAEIKGLTNIVEYEYELIDQDYVNILSHKNYTKEILQKLSELCDLNDFLLWLNKHQALKIMDIAAFQFQSGEYLMGSIKEWDSEMHATIDEYIFKLFESSYLQSWLDDKMKTIERTVNCIRGGIKQTV